MSAQVRPAEDVQGVAPGTEPLTGTGRSATVLNLVGLLSRLTLGVVLVVAGAVKVTSPAVSARAVRAFMILPYDLAGYVGYALPVAEIGIGILLVTGLLTRAAATVGALLMVAFLTGIISAWARGLSIDCGCFGGGGQVATGQARYLLDVIRDAALLGCATWLVVRPGTRASLDRRLFG